MKVLGQARRWAVHPSGSFLEGWPPARKAGAATTVPASPPLPEAARAGQPFSQICCPVPAAIHPAADELNDATLCWLREHELYADQAQLRRLERTRPGLLAARVVPDGAPGPLQVFTDFHTWLFAFDDEYCDEGAPAAMPAREWTPFLARLLRQAETGTAELLPGNRYARALQDIAQRLSACCAPEQKIRWVNALRMYFSALVWETQSRQPDGRARPRLTAADYVLMRLHNGAMHSSIALLDVAAGYVLPASQRECAEVSALIEMTAILVSWDNDIFSWRKERQGGAGWQQNFLDVLAPGHAEALRLAVCLRNGVMDRFTVLADHVTADAEPELRQFVAALGHWVRANLDFSRETARYADPERGVPRDWPATVSARWLADPATFPALAWWDSVRERQPA
jgi:hypothetical protein